MSIYWVIDSKCKVLPQSALPQDGSAFYYGRSVVPAESEELATKNLISLLQEQDILVESVLKIAVYEKGLWADDDDFEVHLSYEDACDTNEIQIGCFVSEKSLKRAQ